MRKILPRLEIRRQDGLANKMPTVLRSGDPNRLGNSRVIFDDTKTIFFENYTQGFHLSFGEIEVDVPSAGPYVNYPSLMHTASQFTGAVTSSIWLTANTVKGVTDNPAWISPSSTALLAPFTEEGLHEQDIKSTDFYKTGSDPGILGTNDFSTNIGNKTQIRLSLPVNTTTYLLSQTASLYYYNNAHGVFELVGENELEPPGNSVGYAFDSKLFSPFGSFTISGSHANLGEGKIPFSGFLTSVTGTNAFATAMQYEQTGSALLNAAYAANVSQSIDIGRYITHPFLLEKAIIEIPITCGAGWGTDSTRASFGNPDNSTATKFIDAAWDYGGPAITVSLLRQADNTHRDLIMSGTITPAADSSPFGDALGDWFFLSSSGYPSFYQYGFGAYATPAAQVLTDPWGVATSSVRFNMMSAVSNGYTSIHHRNGSYVNQTRLININPIGRAGNGVQSGRSVFGREYVMPAISNERTENVLNGGGTGEMVNHVNRESHAYSPYLLMPGDKIILAISKHRPVKYGPTHSTVTSASLNSRLVGSHDVGIYAGKIKISLYGTHIRHGKEYNNTLNQLLSTDSVYETIGEDPVLDQFDTSNAHEYSGSYVDFIMSGTLSERRVVLSSRVLASQDKIITSPLHSEKSMFKWELGTFNRFTQATSDNERYYDSLAPKISDIHKINGGSLMKYAPVVDNFAVIVFDWKYDQEDNSIPYSTLSDNRWTTSFPFEPRYSHLIRNLSPASSFLTTKEWTGVLPDLIIPIDPVAVSRAMIITQYNTASFTGFGYISLIDVHDSLGVISSEKEITKYVYGIGNFNTCHYYGQELLGTPYAPAGRSWYGSPSSPNDPFQARTRVDIRGWKYGLLNAFPQNTKVIHRRDRYGQFRDMLEQRLDGKMFDNNFDNDIENGVRGELRSPIQAKFIGPDNKVVKPEYTYSSNLSLECTSSLPFCDGLVLNREEPIDAGRIGTTTVVTV